VTNGGCWDLGYPRTVQRPDGKLVTMYYFNDDPQRERYIAATIWDPPEAVQNVIVHKETGRFGRLAGQQRNLVVGQTKSSSGSARLPQTQRSTAMLSTRPKSSLASLRAQPRRRPYLEDGDALFQRRRRRRKDRVP